MVIHLFIYFCIVEVDKRNCDKCENNKIYRNAELRCVCDSVNENEEQNNAAEAEADIEQSLVIKHYCSKLREKNKVMKPTVNQSV